MLKELGTRTFHPLPPVLPPRAPIPAAYPPGTHPSPGSALGWCTASSCVFDRLQAPQVLSQQHLCRRSGAFHGDVACCSRTLGFLWCWSWLPPGKCLVPCSPMLPAEQAALMRGIKAAVIATTEACGEVQARRETGPPCHTFDDVCDQACDQNMRQNGGWCKMQSTQAQLSGRNNFCTVRSALLRVLHLQTYPTRDTTWGGFQLQIKIHAASTIQF